MIEVRVFRGRTLVSTGRFEDPEDAQAAAERWSETPGVTCEIDDLSFRHDPEQILGDVVDLEPGEDAVGGVPEGEVTISTGHERYTG